MGQNCFFLFFCGWFLGRKATWCFLNGNYLTADGFCRGNVVLSFSPQFVLGLVLFLGQTFRATRNSRFLGLVFGSVLNFGEVGVQ